MSGINSFLSGVKSSKKNFFIVYFNFSDPFFPRVVPPHTSNTGNIIASNFPVSNIGGICTYSKITFSVVQSVVINMVNVHSMWYWLHNKAMKFCNFMIDSFLQFIPTPVETYTPPTSQFLYSNLIFWVKKKLNISINSTIYNHYSLSLSGVNQLCN
jgi:hypothetical protein